MSAQQPKRTKASALDSTSPESKTVFTLRRSSNRFSGVHLNRIPQCFSLLFLRLLSRDKKTFRTQSLVCLSPDPKASARRSRIVFAKSLSSPGINPKMLYCALLIAGSLFHFSSFRPIHSMASCNWPENTKRTYFSKPMKIHNLGTFKNFIKNLSLVWITKEWKI